MKKTIDNIKVVVEQQRSNVAAFGELIGRQVFKVTPIEIIRDFEQKRQEARDNGSLFITSGITRYKVEGINIVGAVLDKDINNAPVMILNPGFDTEIVCPLGNSHITSEVTIDSVREALDSLSIGKSRIFSSGKKLAKFVNQRNELNERRIDDLISMLKDAKDSIHLTSEKNIASVEEYYRQLDSKKGNPSYIVTEEED